MKENLWQEHFFSECKKLARFFEWAKILPKKVKSFKGKETMTKYLVEIENITRSFRFSQPASNPSESKKASQESNFYMPSHELEGHNASITNKDELKKMLFKTPLLEDQYHALHKIEKGKETMPKLVKKFSTSNSFKSFRNNTFVQGDVFQCIREMKDEGINENDEREIEEEEWEKVRILNHYRSITEKIEKDLKDIQSNIFSYLNQQFISYFCNKYERLLCSDKKYSELTDKTREEYIKKAESCFAELKQFIRVFSECISIFYRFQNFKTTLVYFLFTKENILNFMTSFIFGDYIYPLIYEIQKKIDKSMIALIEKQVEVNQNCKPQDFEISEKFCLNERTANYIFLKRKAEYLEKIRNQNEKCEETNTTFSLENLMMGRASTVNKQPFERSNDSLNDEETLRLNHYTPYSRAIKNLKKIHKHKSPLHKLKHIINISKLVLQEIRDFYEIHCYNFDDNLGGDDMLSIYVYIVAKAKLPGLITDCAIIDKFITSNLTNSIYGYYLVTIQVCLKYLATCKNRTSDEEKIGSSKMALRELMESEGEVVE